MLFGFDDDGVSFPRAIELENIEQFVVNEVLQHVDTDAVFVVKTQILESAEFREIYKSELIRRARIINDFIVYFLANYRMGYRK